MIATGLKHKWYSGAGDASYENVPLVDANGKRLPYPDPGLGGCRRHGAGSRS